jgi:hypothetical protein
MDPTPNRSYGNGPAGSDQSDPGDKNRDDTTSEALQRASTDPQPSSPDDSTTGTAEKNLARTGYRVGAPRVQGPDPYNRLETESLEPSNVRHFPTLDRELGDNLNLSGLLGPRDHDSQDPKSSSIDRLRPPTKSSGEKSQSGKTARHSNDDSEATSDADSNGPDSADNRRAKAKKSADQTEPS